MFLQSGKRRNKENVQKAQRKKKRQPLKSFSESSWLNLALEAMWWVNKVLLRENNFNIGKNSELQLFI